MATDARIFAAELRAAATTVADLLHDAAAMIDPATPPPPPPVVARVAIVPSATSVVAGASVLLQATAYDAAGAAIPGVPVVWASADPAQATVGQDGTVHAISAGVVTVTATAGGQSIGAVVTVTAIEVPPPPPPPPPPPGSMHEPAGMTAYLTDVGSDLIPAGMTATGGWTASTTTAIVSDPSNPTGSGEAIEKRWRKGMGTDSAAKPGLLAVWHWSSIRPGFRPAKTLYVRMRVWFSANWPDPDGNLAGMKFFYLRTSKSNTNLLFTSKNPDGRLHWATLTKHGAPGNYFFDTWSKGQVLHPLGAWHTVEFVFTMNSALDVSDGRVQMWVDDVLVSDRTGILFVGAADVGFSLDFDGLQFYPLRGTVDYTFDRDDQFRLGELYVSGK